MRPVKYSLRTITSAVSKVSTTFISSCSASGLKSLHNACGVSIFSIVVPKYNVVGNAPNLLVRTKNAQTFTIIPIVAHYLDLSSPTEQKDGLQLELNVATCKKTMLACPTGACCNFDGKFARQ